MTRMSAGVRDSARAANSPPKPQPTMTICARPVPVNTPSTQPQPRFGGDYPWLQARVHNPSPSAGPGDNNMPDNETAAAAARTQSRLPAALTWMPVQLVLMFIALVAIDLACQLLRAALVHVAPAALRDTAGLLGALLLSVVMIAAYRFLVRVLERRTADELQSSGAVRALAPGVLLGAGLFALAYAILWTLGVVSFTGYGGFAGAGQAFANAI